MMRVRAAMNDRAADTVALFGLQITNVSVEQAVESIKEQILSGRTHQVVTANLDFATNSPCDQPLQQVICDFSLVLPGGAPMLWASSLFGLREAHFAQEAGQTLIVDMSATIRVEADGPACLLEARRIRLADGLRVWLTGMSNPVRRVLQFSSLSDLFRISATTAEVMSYTAFQPFDRREPSSRQTPGVRDSIGISTAAIAGAS